MADYSRFYIEEKASNAFQTIDREEENLTLPLRTHRLQQLFESSTATDDTYHLWENIRQAAGGQPARITKIPGELADLKGSLPPGSISDYAQKQRYYYSMHRSNDTMHRSNDFLMLWTLHYAAMLSASSDQKIPGTRWWL